jgi:hypothetical protein
MKKKILTIPQVWMKIRKRKIPVSGEARGILSRFAAITVKIEAETEELLFSIEEFLGEQTVVITIENGKLATLQEGETESFTFRDEHGHTLTIRHTIPHQKMSVRWDEDAAQ